MPAERMSRGGGEIAGQGGAVRGTAPALVLQADPLAVRAALSQVVRWLEEQGLGLEEQGTVELVLAEALNNIVEHAYLGRGGEIQLWWTLGPGGLHVRLADSGQQMPGGTAPLTLGRCPGDHAALVPEGGFGWFLITGLARNIVYRRERGLNVLTFRLIVGEACAGGAPAGRG